MGETHQELDRIRVRACMRLGCSSAARMHVPAARKLHLVCASKSTGWPAATSKAGSFEASSAAASN